MNKKRLLPGCLVLSVLCLISGCAGKPLESESVLTASESFVSETDSVASLIETTSETVEPVSRSDRSESAEPSTSPTETTVAEVPESEQKTVLWEAPNGELFYKEDAFPDGSLLAFDRAVYRPSTGVFYDSFTNPELFNLETYDFLGELIEYDESDWHCIQSGDTIKGYRVKKAKTLFNINDNGYLKEDGYIPLSNSIVFEDDITLTGYLSYYPDDESLYIQGGDLFFLPDQSYEGMPLVNYYPYCNVKSGKKYFDDEDEIPLPVFYSDSISISVGNLFNDYADSTTLKQIIEDDEKMKRTRVEITLGELSLMFHDMDMRIYGSASGKIVSVKEIE